jgi:hypothetical protein
VVEKTLELPEGKYDVEPLVGNLTVKLSGEVSTLNVGAARDTAKLDASQLEADEIIITGPIAGTAAILVSAAEGKVELRGAMGDQTKLSIKAPDGRVCLGTVALGAGDINGAAAVDVIAHDVDIRSRITGGATVTITLTKGGRLRFSQVDGGGKLFYRKADPKDPSIDIDRGVVSEGGQVKLLVD